MVKITINRKHLYTVRIIHADGGEFILKFCGTVVKKEQTKGLLGISTEIDEVLHVDDFYIELSDELKKSLLRD